MRCFILNVFKFSKNGFNFQFKTKFLKFMKTQSKNMAQNTMFFLKTQSKTTFLQTKTRKLHSFNNFSQNRRKTSYKILCSF